MADPRIRMRHLMVFLEVAHRAGVMAAADALSVTQPAISKTVQELEEILGVALFVRSRAGMALTPEGRLFLRHAEASVAALNAGVDTVRFARSAETEIVRVGALPTVAAQLMPPAARRYKAAGGAGLIRIISAPNSLLLRDLRAGDLDMVVGRMAEADGMSGLSFEHLYSEAVVFVVRRGHPLTQGGASGDPRRIAGFPVLLPTGRAIIRPLVDRLLMSAGVAELPDRIETVSAEFGRRYVLGGDAVWIISRGVVAADLADGTLVELPVDTRETLGPVGLTMRVDARPGPEAVAFVAAVREEAAGMRGPG